MCIKVCILLSKLMLKSLKRGCFNNCVEIFYTSCYRYLSHLQYASFLSHDQIMRSWFFSNPIFMNIFIQAVQNCRLSFVRRSHTLASASSYRATVRAVTGRGGG